MNSSNKRMITLAIFGVMAMCATSTDATAADAKTGDAPLGVRWIAQHRTALAQTNHPLNSPHENPVDSAGFS